MAETIKKSSRATQEFVPIKEVRDGILLLKDNSMRAILLTSSINFELKSGQEQQAIIIQFQNFLSSINFPIQISIQSRKLDIRPYIALLEQKLQQQTNDLMKIQTHQYIDYVKSLTETSNIMTKNFFIVIPYNAAIIKTSSGPTNPFSSFMGSKKENDAKAKTDDVMSFEENRSQLEQRIEVVSQGLSRCGVRVVKLGTDELIELFYKIFNPGDIDKPIHIEQ